MFFKGYSETVIDHFMEPRNNYEMMNPSGVGQAGDPSCGDAVGIYIRPTRDLQLCSVYRMELTDWGMEPGKQYTAIQGMKAGMPMVLQVRFDGDMTAYGVTAVDMEGNVYRYVLSVSGRDGTLVLSQWP